MNTSITLLFIALGVLHLIPGAAGLAPSRLAALYGVKPDDAVMMTLLQHRAVLLGVVGCLMIAAAFLPGHRVLALALCGLSMGSFMVIAALRKTTGGPLNPIFMADAGGIVLLVIAAGLMWQQAERA